MSAMGRKQALTAGIHVEFVNWQRVLLLAMAMSACGQANPQMHDPLPASDPYVQTLRAMMNLKGCKGLRGQFTTPAQLKRSQELIAKAQGDLSDVEAFARSKGLGDYLEQGRTSFERQVSEELNLICHPDEQGASKGAHDAIENLRVHVAKLSVSN